MDGTSINKVGSDTTLGELELLEAEARIESTREIATHKPVATRVTV